MACGALQPWLPPTSSSRQKESMRRRWLQLHGMRQAAKSLYLPALCGLVVTVCRQIPAHARRMQEILRKRAGARLRGDARMVRARQPQRAPALHALEAHHAVLQGRKHGVAHVQAPRHVRRRHGCAQGLHVNSVPLEVLDLWVGVLVVVGYVWCRHNPQHNLT